MREEKRLESDNNYNGVFTEEVTTFTSSAERSIPEFVCNTNT